jgi:hypothetical protein
MESGGCDAEAQMRKEPEALGAAKEDFGASEEAAIAAPAANDERASAMPNAWRSRLLRGDMGPIR